MLKNRITQQQSNQDLGYPDAKPAQKAKHYEDFTILAERLRKEGRLDEKNYSKMVRKFWMANSFLAGLMILGLFLDNNFLYFFMFGGLIIWGVISYRLDLNRYCYLFNFGEVAEGEIVEVNKYERNHPHIHYLISLGKDIKLNKDAMYNYDIVFSFNDKNDKLITISQQDAKRFSPKKFYKVGDKVTVYYNPNNSNDALIEAKEEETNFNKENYNLLLTSK
jgi:hypothetical protein